MKLRNKLLVALAPAATIATIMPIALTSCGEQSKGSNSVTYAGNKTITTTQSTYTIDFTLAKALDEGETVKLSWPSIHGSAVPTISNIDGTKITVTITDSTSGAFLPSTTTFDLKFSGYAQGSTVITSWETTITGFTFTKTA